MTRTEDPGVGWGGGVARRSGCEWRVAGGGRCTGGGGGLRLPANPDHTRRDRCSLLTKALRGQVLAELGPDGATAAVSAHHLAPHHAQLAALLLCVRAVDVGDALAQVELQLLLGSAAIDLDERGVAVLVCLGTLIAQDLALDEQPHSLAPHFDVLRGGRAVGGFSNTTKQATKAPCHPSNALLRPGRPSTRGSSHCPRPLML